MCFLFVNIHMTLFAPYMTWWLIMWHIVWSRGHRASLWRHLGLGKLYQCFTNSQPLVPRALWVSSLHSLLLQGLQMCQTVIMSLAQTYQSYLTLRLPQTATIPIKWLHFKREMVGLPHCKAMACPVSQGNYQILVSDYIQATLGQWIFSIPVCCMWLLLQNVCSLSKWLPHCFIIAEWTV